MLNRRKIRRYLLAVLTLENIPQDENCNIGPIWEGCDDQVKASITDSETGQLQETIEASRQEAIQTSVFIDISVPNVSYTLSSTQVDKSRISFVISLGVIAASGAERVEILDELEKRIFYRLYTKAKIEDAQEIGSILKSPMSLASGNVITVKVTDDNSYGGDYNIREMLFTQDTNECIKTPNCDVEALCFDFSNLTVLNKEASDHA